MAKPTKRKCPACKQTSEFRADQKTCGCLSAKPSETSEISENKWSIVLPRTNIHTLEQLVEYCEIDLSIWEVKKFVANKWEANAGDGQTMPLFQIKAFLDKKIAAVDARKELEDIKKLGKTQFLAAPKIRKTTSSSGNMLELDIPDVHFGKLAWGVETGGQNYDTKLAVAVFNRAFDALLDRTSGYTFDEIWLVVGNDILNSDNAEGRTTSGTYVSSDIRYHRTFTVVRNLIIQKIEILRHRAKKVKVIMVPGNHDHLSVWHLGDSLECKFSEYDDVEIDNTPKYYKIKKFGQVMLMYTHGNKGKRKDYPLLMATEEPEIFGGTKFREIHTGHYHTDKVEEQHGVKVRILSALCPADAWHAENGYVGNLRSAEAFIWNQDEGLIGTAIYTDQDIEAE